MVTKEILDYIKNQRASGRPESEIRQDLMSGGGWPTDEADKALELARPESKPIATLSRQPELQVEQSIQPEPIIEPKPPTEPQPVLQPPPEPQTRPQFQSNYRPSIQVQATNLGVPEVQVTKRKPIFALVLIIFILLLIGGGSLYAYKSGFLFLPSSPNPLKEVSTGDSDVMKDVITQTTPTVAYLQLEKILAEMPPEQSDKANIPLQEYTLSNIPISNAERIDLSTISFISSWGKIVGSRGSWVTFEDGTRLGLTAVDDIRLIYTVFDPEYIEPDLILKAEKYFEEKSDFEFLRALAGVTPDRVKDEKDENDAEVLATLVIQKMTSLSGPKYLFNTENYSFVTAQDTKIFEAMIFDKNGNIVSSVVLSSQTGFDIEQIKEFLISIELR